jgi:hypothetical protein
MTIFDTFAVLMRSKNPIPIELRTVHSFSIGETEDQRPCIWMLGRCGAWYEVVPSAAYKPTYDLMAEAVFLYYRIVDYYSSPRARIEPLAKRDDISWLFLQVSQRNPPGFPSTHTILVCICCW